MQGWITRNRLREEQERAKIEQARKEGFDDGYLAGKTFAGMEIASLRAKLEAVPVEEIRTVMSVAAGDIGLREFDEGAFECRLLAIDRWLATAAK